MHEHAAPFQLHHLLSAFLLFAAGEHFDLDARDGAALKPRLEVRLVLPALHTRLDRLAHPVVVDLDE